jgi:hypothetical protein
MKRGACKMCLVEKDLVLSHLMPAALYGYCREKGGSAVLVGDGRVMYTDRETKDHLLCLQCEDILNRGGETWVNPKLATIGPRTFPLYDLLAKSPAACVSNEGAIYRTRDNPEIDVKKLAHFALGIFWKASVHSWKGDTANPKINLGAHSEAIRTWLQGEIAFPRDVNLQIIVSKTERAQIILKEPAEGTPQTWGSFWMHVPGVLFILDVGPNVPIETQMLCFWKNSDHLVAVSDDISRFLERRFAGEYLESRKTNSYLKTKAKRDQGKADNTSSSE